MDNIVGQTLFFNFGVATGLEEGKLTLNLLNSA